ncbi:MAG: hypothetical protein LBG95_05885 [Treponema sp.]|jgi:hypothetical protein|nr:hypothetical protein [Treponema sp.]
MKKNFWIVIFGAMAIGFLGAQDFGFGFQNTAQNFSINPLGFNNNLQLGLMAEGEDSEGGESGESGKGGKPFPGSPFVAGLLNVPFGIYSWMTGDWFGGALTAGLEAAGVGIIVWFNIVINTGGTITQGEALFSLLSIPLIGGGMIFGGIRGTRQYKKSRIAWTGNPMDHITAAALPTLDGSFAGSLTFRAAF